MAVLHLAVGPMLLSQGTVNLSTYLESHPIPGAVVVGAERFRAFGQPASLQDFGAKVVKIGAITAIVPTNMVQFADVSGRQPDLYDGLPLNSKVLYLATTLNPTQWKLLTGNGIGLGDLDEDQQGVFRSILPKSFQWITYHVGDNYQPTKNLSSGKLTGEQLSGVRLRLSRQLMLNVYLAGRPNSYSMTDVPSGVEPGGEMSVRQSPDPGGRLTNFGVEFQQKIPTGPKPSDLKLTPLTALLSLPKKTTLEEALRLTSSVTKVQIQADRRVRNLSVSMGAKVSAADFLSLCAQSVGGTYRKLGDRYLLVQDRVGLGSRALLYADWLNSAGQIVEEREKSWRAALAKQGISQRVGWNADDRLSPGSDVMDRLDRDFTAPSSPFPSSQLGPEIEKILKTFVKNSGRAGQEYRDDVVDVSSSIAYQFVLPGGKRLQIEGYLGNDYFFNQPSKPPESRPEPLLKRVKPEVLSSAGLLVVADSADDAKPILEAVKRFGFGEIWVQTESKEALSALIATGTPVKLVVRPWNVPYGTQASDRTILGDTGQSLWTRLANSSAWVDFASSRRMQVFPRANPHLISGEVLSPWDPRAARRLRGLTDLSQVAGLSGTVVLDSQIHGYEPGNQQMTIGRYEPLVRSLWAFGYADEARTEFFDQFGVDPVDFYESSMVSELNLSVPNFPVEYESKPMFSELRDAWVALRSKKSRDLLSAWLTPLPGSVYCDMNRQEQCQPPAGYRIVTALGADRIIPSYSEQVPRPLAGQSYMVVSLQPSDSNGDDFVNQIRGTAGTVRVNRMGSLVVDISTVRPERWQTTLARAIEPVVDRPSR